MTDADRYPWKVVLLHKPGRRGSDPVGVGLLKRRSHWSLLSGGMSVRPAFYYSRSALARCPGPPSSVIPPHAGIHPNEVSAITP